MSLTAYIFNAQGDLLNEIANTEKLDLNDKSRLFWLDLCDESPVQLAKVLSGFKLHPLSIEDCIEPNPSPKVEVFQPAPGEDYAPYLFTVTHAFTYLPAKQGFDVTELHCILGSNYLITVHNNPVKCIKDVQSNLKAGLTPLARAGDRLLHNVLDRLVNSYGLEIERFAQDVDALEEQTFLKPSGDRLNEILRLRRSANQLKQGLGAQADVLARLAGGDICLIRAKLLPYFRDTKDSLDGSLNKTQRLADSIITLLQVCLNLSSNQTGEVVKVLTLITVVTTPLMMIGTWYGMNFKDMPELGLNHGYLVAAGCMILSTAFTFYYFKHKRWI